MASRFEEGVRKAMEKDGWTVLSSGWPDFLITRGDEITAYELKSRSDKLRPNQEKMLEVFVKAGIDTRVLCEDPHGKLAKKYRHWMFTIQETILPWKRPRYAWNNLKKFERDFDGLGIS